MWDEVIKNFTRVAKVMELSVFDGETMGHGSSTTLETSVQSRKAVAELKGFELENDTVVKFQKGVKCTFCDHMFAGGPSRIRDHLLNLPGNHVKPCTPSPIWKQRYHDVLAELKLRMLKATQVKDDNAKQEAARRLVSKQETTIMNSLGMTPTNDQVNEAWAKALVKKGLAIDLVDDPFFRSAITMTARAGRQYVDGQNNT